MIDIAYKVYDMGTNMGITRKGTECTCVHMSIESSDVFVFSMIVMNRNELVVTHCMGYNECTMRWYDHDLYLRLVMMQ